MRHRKFAINGSLGAAVVVLAALGYFTVTSSDSSTSTGVRTATVSQGNVAAAVSATGNITSAMNLGVSFTDCSGALTAIDVKPGQVVTQGQPLATVDPTKAQTALANAQSQLAAAQAADYTGGANVVDAVLNSASSWGALEVVPAVYPTGAGGNTSAQLAADQAALLKSQATYLNDEATKSAVNVAVTDAQKAVGVDLTAVTTARTALLAAQSAKHDVTTAQEALTDAQHQLVTDEATLNSAELLLTQTLTFDQQSIVYWQAQVTYDKGQGPAPSTPAPVAPSGSSSVPSAGSAKTAAPGAATNGSGGAVPGGTASGSGASGGGGASSGKTAAGGATGSSGDSATSGSKSTPAGPASSSAGGSGGGSATATPSQTALNNAQLAVAAAQQSLTDCTLTAPVSGTVITVNGVVGAPPVTSSSSAGASTGAASAGSGGGGASSGSAGGGGASSSASTSSSGSSTSSSGGFITLADLGQMQIKGAFSETDVSNVQAGQQASVVFPALTDVDNPAGLTATGTVTGVDLSSVTTNNVVTYGVTIALSGPSPRIKLGETGNITVTTATQTGVLTVPTNAITALGPRKTVTVQNGSTNQVTPVQVGIAGNGLTEVTSGVSAGQKLVLPSATPSTSSSGGFPRGAGATGGGGGVSARLGGGS